MTMTYNSKVEEHKTNGRKTSPRKRFVKGGNKRNDIIIKTVLNPENHGNKSMNGRSGRSCRRPVASKMKCNYKARTQCNNIVINTPNMNIPWSRTQGGCLIRDQSLLRNKSGSKIKTEFRSSRNVYINSETCTFH